ncbi:hypothetical protein AOCH_005617 [Aspergillus ochraceoroseus]|nr:hypothetical protein AOCH_005617 [Aspergillus ochraceoroseus]
MLERGLREDDVELERMYVLPTVQGQSWTLGKMADIFDALPDPAGEGEWEAEAEAHNGVDETETEAEQASTQATKAAKLAEYYEYRRTALRTQEWGGKRLLLAMIDKGMGGDGTVVYYVVQEGAVKPRQN